MMTDDDRGSIAPLVPIIMIALLLLGGLVVDGARVLNARSNAQSYAEEAARAGASAVLPSSPSKLELDTGLAQSRVEAYCKAIENTTHADVEVTFCNFDPNGPHFTQGQDCGKNDPDPNDIVVHIKVQVRIDSTLLGMTGFGQFSSSAVASAQPYQGFSSTTFFC